MSQVVNSKKNLGTAYFCSFHSLHEAAKRVQTAYMSLADHISWEILVEVSHTQTPIQSTDYLVHNLKVLCCPEQVLMSTYSSIGAPQ